jgi:type IV pilus biogenesis protein CpaD/CtpE
MINPKPVPLNPKHQAIAVALARGCSITAAAKTCGCSTRTVARRLESPLFVEEVERLRAAIVGRTTSRLSSYSLDAVRALHKLLTSESSQAVLGAARAILELSAKYRADADHAAKTAEIDRRLKALEAERLKIHGGAA